MTASKNIRYIPAVDHLRAFAALLVVLYHSVSIITPLQTQNWPRAGNPFSALVYEGHTGVALFMVLSGFIFTYGSADREIDYKTFLLNRVLRIYPLMLALVFVGVSVYASQLNPVQVIESLLPVQNLRAANPTIRLAPYNTLFWTITVEFQFYLIFPFLHRLLLRRGVPGLLPLLGFLILARWSALRITDHELFVSSRDLSYWTILGRLDQFLIGMIAATVALRLTVASRLLRWALPLGVAGLLLALYLFNQLGGWPGEPEWKILWPPVEASLWALIVLGYLATLHGRGGKVSRLVAALGAISYSVYLTHLTVLDILVHNGWVLHTPRPPFLAALLTGLTCVFPIVVLVSTLTYHAIEKPFLELRRRYLVPVPGTPAPLPVPAMVTAQAPATPATTVTTRRWLLAGFAGVGLLILAGLLFAFQRRGDDRLSVPTRAIREAVRLGAEASRQVHPGGYRVLFASDENAPTAVAVGRQLTQLGEPFVVAGGSWTNAFGAQHAWQALDEKALRPGLSPWYVLPRSMLLWGMIADRLHFPLRDGALLSLTSPTLELSAAGHLLELEFVPRSQVKDLILGGWAEPDGGGTWTRERYAALAFRPRIIEGSGVEISVDAQPFLSPAHGVTRQRLRLRFNDLPIGPEQQFTAAGTVRFSIPEAVWNAEAAKLDAQVSLVFEFPDAVSPASLGPEVGEDTRLLALFFTKMHLKVWP